MSWAEAYELASQLQAVQTQTGDVRLSDRNCVELVSKLIEKKLLDLVFTQDGREYLTRKQLYTEIEQELQFAKGRIGLLDLCDTLNVSVENVEPVVKELIKDSTSVFMVNSEIIQLSYLESIIAETNLKLQENGLISFSDICHRYDLPLNFLNEHFAKYIGTLLNGSYSSDKQSLVTEGHRSLQRGKIKGALLAATKPISLKSLASVTHVPDSTLLPIVLELVANKSVAGSIDRGQDMNSMYIPDVFLRHQLTTVKNMLDNTGMIKFNQLTKLAITDPKQFIERNCADEKLLFLPDGCVAEKILSEPLAALEETVCEGSWLDLSSVLPSTLTTENILDIYRHCVSANSDLKKEFTVLCETVFVTNKFLQETQKKFAKKIDEKVAGDIKENFLMVEKLLSSAGSTGASSRKEERKQKALGKKAAVSKGPMTVGGRGGREAKTKKVVKNKFRERQEDAEESESDREADCSVGSELQFGSALKKSEIENILSQEIKDVPCDDFCSSLAAVIFEPLRMQYKERLTEAFEKNVQKKVSVSDMQAAINNFAQMLPILEKSLHEFKETPHYSQIEQFLIKNECSVALNNLINIILDEHNCAVNNPNDITPESRKGLISNVKNDGHRASLLETCSKFESVAEFAESFLKSCQDCNVYIGKLDKKKEKLILSEHLRKTELSIEKAETLQDLLHRSCHYTFQKTFKSFINLPGKFVSDFIEIFTDKIDQNLLDMFLECQKHVTSQRKENGDLETETSDPQSVKLCESLRTMILKPSN